MKTRTRKRTKRKLLTLLLSLSMLLCYVPQVAVADDVTKVSTASDFRAAVENGGSIQLTSDIILAKNLSSNKAVTLDLNGHTITFANEDDGVNLYITNGGNWTILDTSAGKAGKITGISSSYGGILLSQGNGTSSESDSASNTSLILQSGTLEKGMSIGQKASFTITGGTVLGDVKCSGTIYADGGVIGSTTDNDLNLAPSSSSSSGSITRHTNASRQTTILSKCLFCNGTISAGIFKGSVSRTSYYGSADGNIKGGSFYDEVIIVNTMSISGGTFYISDDSDFPYDNCTVSTDCKIVTYITDLDNYQNNDNVYAKQVVKTGEKATEPDKSTRSDGYKFDGWYADSSFNTAFNFDSTISADTTIYAKWTKCTHTNSTEKATCTTSATCSICSGTIPALGHQESSYKTDDTYHWKVCTRSGCSEVLNKTAHTYNNTKVNDTYRKTAATCTSPAVYYKSCVCGKCDKNVAATFTNGNALGHSDTDNDHICNTCNKKISECSGGTATCQKKAECTTCGKEYGEKDFTNHTSNEGSWLTDATQHAWKHSCCGTINLAVNHNGGTATCQNKAVCKDCGVSYGELDLTKHTGQLGGWQTSETEHWKIWSCCSAEASKAVHDYNQSTVNDKYLKTAANCKSAAVYYKSCVCGEFSKADGAATFEYGEKNANNHIDENNDNKCDRCSKSLITYSGGSSVAPSTTSNVTNTTETTATGTEKVTNAEVTSKTTTKADGSKTTTTTVDTKTADKIVEKAVENKSETVVIDAASSTGSSSGSSSSASGQAAASGKDTSAGSDFGAAAPVAAEVAIPAATVTQLSEKTDAAVTIKTDIAEVTLDQKAVAAIAAAVETKESGSTSAATGEVKVIVTTTSNTKSAVKLDVKIETPNGEVKNLKGGSVSVTVKLNTTLAAKKLACVYIDDRGIYHKVKGQKNANNTFTFKTL